MQEKYSYVNHGLLLLFTITAVVLIEKGSFDGKPLTVDLTLPNPLLLIVILAPWSSCIH